ncbi:hypothetical protein HK098_008258 [Nowakowskiella sp. JEL0407]|nr:hypothetical protein HK098_008258 [Nowakowskiella sp. JEL0407]
MKNSENALLESPTGTGKSLALLVGAVGWQEEETRIFNAWINQKKNQNSSSQSSQRSFSDSQVPNFRISASDLSASAQGLYLVRSPPIIYFASRTVNQLRQAVQQLKLTKYRPKMSILASRKHYCIHPIVSASEELNDDCRKYKNAKCKCSKAVKVDGIVHCSGCHCAFFVDNPNPVPQTEEIWDLEDLNTDGNKKMFCPYYAARNLAKVAQIVFLPYNYIFNPLIQSAIRIDLSNAVVIIDEAHNIEEVCIESISENILDNIKEDLLVDQKYAPDDISPMYDIVIITVDLLLKILERPTGKRSGNLEDHTPTFTYTYSGEEAVEIFKHVIPDLQNAVSRISSHIITLEEREKFVKISEYLFGQLEKLELSLCMLSENPSKYSFFVTHTLNRQNKIVLRKFKIHCLDPSLCFTQVSEQARSIILTSGTLAPMQSIKHELGVDFKITLEASHVVKKEQLWVGVIPFTPDTPIELKGVFGNRKNTAYLDGLGKAILRIMQLTPDGMLVFLPSYTFMNDLVDRWKVTGLYDGLEECKKLYFEPRKIGNVEFSGMVKRYQGDVESRCGAAFFCIYRGKMSEGIDFAGRLARTVVAVGIPYPSYTDICVAKKREYNDLHNPFLKGLQWYETQAFRAVNQAIGRCIRNAKDWGAMILLDSRFGEGDTRISKWLREQIKGYDSFELAENSMIEFFERKLMNDN